MSELDRLEADMAEVRAAFNTVYKPDQWDAWLHTPAPIFGGESAWSLVQQGKTERVLAALDQLASGAFV